MEPVDLKEPGSLDEDFDNRDEKEIDEEAKEVSEKAIDDFYAEMGDQIRELSERMADLGRKIDVTLDQRLVFDKLETLYERLASEHLEGSDTRLDRAEKEAKAERDKIGDESRKNRARNRKLLMALLFGVLVSGGVIYFLIQYFRGKAPDESEEFTQKDADKAKELVEKWRNLSDAAMWKRIAEYVDQNHPSLQSQMMIMGYIKQWADKVQMSWSASAKADVIEALVDAYDENKASADIYRVLPKQIYDNKALPRAVAADVCELALAQILATRNQDDDKLVALPGGTGA